MCDTIDCHNGRVTVSIWRYKASMLLFLLFCDQSFNAPDKMKKMDRSRAKEL